MELVAQTKFQIELNKANAEAYSQHISALKEMNMLTQDMSDSLYGANIEELEGQLDSIKQKIAGMFGDGKFSEILSQFIKTDDLDLNVTSNAEETVKVMSLAIARMRDSLAGIKETEISLEASLTGDPKKDEKTNKELAKITSKRIAAEKAINTLVTDRAGRVNIEKELVSKVAEETGAYALEHKKLMSISGRRLDLERAVMDAAQFGMGASISMMQEQVNLAYDLIKTSNIRVKNLEDQATAILKGVKLSDQDKQIVQDTLKYETNSVKVQNTVNSILKDNSVEAGALMKNWENQQDAQANILEQQKKIYDLTKDIREGYLDAVREMSSGAGEFSKIISTQDSGVTNLLQSVSNVTGMHSGTYGIGGTMAKGSTHRSQVSGGFGITGLYFEDPSVTNRKNQDITGYEDSVKKYRDLQKGEGGAPIVQGSNVENSNLFLGAIRESDSKRKEDHRIGTSEALRENADLFRNPTKNDPPLNPAVSPEMRGRVGTNEQMNKEAPAWGSKYLAGSETPPPANAIAQKSSDGQTPDHSNQQRENRGRVELMNIIDKLDQRSDSDKEKLFKEAGAATSLRELETILMKHQSENTEAGKEIVKLFKKTQERANVKEEGIKRNKNYNRYEGKGVKTFMDKIAYTVGDEKGKPNQKTVDSTKVGEMRMNELKSGVGKKFDSRIFVDENMNVSLKDTIKEVEKSIEKWATLPQQEKQIVHDETTRLWSIKQGAASLNTGNKGGRLGNSLAQTEMTPEIQKHFVDGLFGGKNGGNVNLVDVSKILRKSGGLQQDAQDYGMAKIEQEYGSRRNEILAIEDGSVREDKLKELDGQLREISGEGGPLFRVFNMMSKNPNSSQKAVEFKQNAMFQAVDSSVGGDYSKENVESALERHGFKNNSSQAKRIREAMELKRLSQIHGGNVEGEDGVAGRRKAIEDFKYQMVNSGNESHFVPSQNWVENGGNPIRISLELSEDLRAKADQAAETSGAVVEMIPSRG
jgi:hypothetical protein